MVLEEIKSTMRQAGIKTGLESLNISSESSFPKVKDPDLQRWLETAYFLIQPLPYNPWRLPLKHVGYLFTDLWGLSPVKINEHLKSAQNAGIIPVVHQIKTDERRAGNYLDQTGVLLFTSLIWAMKHEEMSYWRTAKIVPTALSALGEDPLAGLLVRQLRRLNRRRSALPKEKSIQPQPVLEPAMKSGFDQEASERIVVAKKLEQPHLITNKKSLLSKRVLSLREDTTVIASFLRTDNLRQFLTRIPDTDEMVDYEQQRISPEIAQMIMYVFAAIRYLQNKPEIHDPAQASSLTNKNLKIGLRYCVTCMKRPDWSWIENLKILYEAFVRTVEKEEKERTNKGS